MCKYKEMTMKKNHSLIPQSPQLLKLLPKNLPKLRIDNLYEKLNIIFYMDVYFIIKSPPSILSSSRKHLTRLHNTLSTANGLYTPACPDTALKPPCWKLSREEIQICSFEPFS